MPVGFAALVADHVEQHTSGDKRLVELANIVLGRPAVGGDGAGRHVVVILAVVAHVGQAVPLGRALQIHGNIVVVGNGRARQADFLDRHVEDRHKPLGRGAGGKDRPVLVNRNAAAENLPLTDQSGRGDNHLRRNEIGRPLFIVGSPPTPV